MTIQKYEWTYVTFLVWRFELNAADRFSAGQRDQRVLRSRSNYVFSVLPSCPPLPLFDYANIAPTV